MSAQGARADRAAVAGQGASVATRRPRLGPIASKVAFWIVLAIFTLIFIYPFIWLLSASLKTTTEVFNNVLIPNPAHFENYSELLDRAPVLNWAWNSVLVSVLAATLQKNLRYDFEESHDDR